MSLADELAAKWRHVISETREIFWTWTEDHSLAYCCEMAEAASNSVELGTYLGASAFAMLSANPLLHLWCVDNFEAFPGMHQTVRYLLRDFIRTGRCELIVGDSAHAAPMLAHVAGELDFVWVDDGHLTSDVLRDIRCFWPLLRSGGVMFGHDYEPGNEVALGITQSGVTHDVPVPRVWRSVKP